VNFVHGTYTNGTVILDEPGQFPEGSQVRVTLDDEVLSDGRPWPKTPAEIEAFLAEIDAIPPLMNEEEHRAWEARRRAEKDARVKLMRASAAEARALFP
jgi:hypothetical protein